jgi:hypothetical protein
MTAAICVGICTQLLGAQGITSTTEPSVVIHPNRPPATKLEAFKPAAGSVVVLGYDDLGSVGSPPVNVDVREMSDTKGAKTMGIAVEVIENWYRRDLSLVDADEIPGLLKGMDALLEMTANPTKFDNFEMRYETQGGLLLTGYNMGRGKQFFTIQVGRDSPVLSGRLNVKDIQKLRAMIEQAAQKISAVQSGK